MQTRFLLCRNGSEMEFWIFVIVAKLNLLLFSRSVVPDSLRPNGLQHTRLPCPSPHPGVFSNSCQWSQWCHPTICSSVIPMSSFLSSIFPSIRAFSNELVLLIRRPKCWSFSFSISTSSEYSGLISFRMVWFDFLAVQRSLKSVPQHHSSKVSIFQHSAFFMAQLSQPYMTTGKTTVLTKQTLVDKVMSLFLIHCLGWSYIFFPGAGVS